MTDLVARLNFAEGKNEKPESEVETIERGYMINQAMIKAFPAKLL